MILKSVKLENIRSYLNEEIDFLDGSVLLAGDIGSGKSTVLQAVEFALFGLKPEMPGSSLLRHGKNRGSVELKFNIDGQKIAIKRVLKKGKNSITQDSGYIIIDDVKKEGTATELKAIVLDLLGYPKSLVSKSKDLIYRYTVYTPQEEMKQILMEDKDMRLDTLRRVFGTDKYKRIRENCAIFLKEIRESVKQGEGMIADLEQKRAEKKGFEQDVKDIEISLKEISSRVKAKKEEVAERKNKIKEIEEKIKEFQKLKNELDKYGIELKNKFEKRNSNREDIERLETEIGELEKDSGVQIEIRIEDVKNKITEKKNEIESIEYGIRKTMLELNEIKIENKKSDELKAKISELSVCPVCKQIVGEEHKHGIIEKQNEKMEEFREKIGSLEEKEKRENEKLKSLKEELDGLKDMEKDFALASLKLKNLREKMDLKNKLLKSQEEIKKEIGKINMAKIELNEKIRGFVNIEENYNQLRDNFEKMLAEEKDLELKKIGMEKEVEGIEKMISKLVEEISRKTEAKKKIAELRDIQNWTNDFFVNIMYSIEKQVMLRLYSEFNELFQSWFSTLMGDETINVRLDEEFTPVIEQNGYETGIENLSGGEKTSLALSYRLSLNKVINDFIEEIKTKDIIILDEPTDGFSSEQLDKIRDILDQLKIKQVIIVSHEPKIESFVDNVIRISKEEHVSSVI